MTTFAIRQYGDPVLRQVTKVIEKIDGRVAKLAEDMIATMYDAPGVGLAANQVGVQRRMFVYDVGDGPMVIVNPTIVESTGEWTYQEGCYDLDGNELSIEADEFVGRVFQHELDHLDGILLVERLDEDQRREAKAILRARALEPLTGDPDGLHALGEDL